METIEVFHAMKLKITNERNLGLVQILLSGMCFGFLGVFGKLSLQRGVATDELLGLRFMLGGVLLGVALMLKSGPRRLALTWFQFILCALLGIFGYALFSSLYFKAIQGLSIGLAVLLLYTFPVWVSVGGWIFLREKIPASRLVLFPLTLIGMALLVMDRFQWGGLPFLLCGLGSGFFYAIYILISARLLKGVNPLTAVVYIQFFAGLTLTLLSFQDWERSLLVIQTIWPILIMMAIICSAAAMGLFQSGLQKLKGWEASLLSTSEPLTGILLAYFFFGEALSLTQLLGGLLVIVSFIILSLPTKYLLDQHPQG